MGRLTERQRLEICVGAILTQNTNWANVLKALARLHEEGIQSASDFMSLPQRRLATLIRSSGYFRQKAKKLKAFVRHLADAGGRIGPWLSGDLKSVRRELLGIYGIGPETADSILLYAGGRPAFVADAYTLRIGQRLGWFRKSDYDHAQRYLTRRLPIKPSLYNEFHALLVALAKDHCRKTPLCLNCPLQGVCRYARTH
jgi:endonuclease-3 related protein